MQGCGAGRSNKEKSFISTHFYVGSSAESKGACGVCLAPGAAAECGCPWSAWGRAWAGCMALLGPSAQTLLLSGDSRAEGSNPMDRSQLGQAAPSPCSQSSELSWQHWGCVPWWLCGPWHGLGAAGQRSCWGLVPVRAWSCSLLCTLLGSGFGDSCVP